MVNQLFIDNRNGVEIVGHKVGFLVLNRFEDPFTPLAGSGIRLFCH